MRLKLITCDVFEAEVRRASARSTNLIEIQILRHPAHQLTDRERVCHLQTVIDALPRSIYQAVLLVAGSCKPSFRGLTARTVPIVLPRAKDCISLLLERSSSTTPRFSRQSPLSFQGLSQRTSLAAEVALPTLTAPLKIAARFDSAQRSSQPRRSTSALERQSARKENPRVSPLKLLMDGYWNYADFLVVPPGWRVATNEQGALTTEETL